mmetsp:Transcript_7756/g.19984  ORF Transcript_7756/g.19984 Transcript_7756/m.19984 type:complete len:348 (-) Transcript_7756:853-1896(-)
MLRARGRQDGVPGQPMPRRQGRHGAPARHRHPVPAVQLRRAQLEERIQGYGRGLRPEGPAEGRQRADCPRHDCCGAPADAVDDLDVASDDDLDGASDDLNPGPDNLAYNHHRGHRHFNHSRSDNLAYNRHRDHHHFNHSRLHHHRGPLRASGGEPLLGAGAGGRRRGKAIRGAGGASEALAAGAPAAAAHRALPGARGRGAGAVCQLLRRGQPAEHRAAPQAQPELLPPHWRLGQERRARPVPDGRGRANERLRAEAGRRRQGAPVRRLRWRQLLLERRLQRSVEAGVADGLWHDGRRQPPAVRPVAVRHGQPRLRRHGPVRLLPAGAPPHAHQRPTVRLEAVQRRP